MPTPPILWRPSERRVARAWVTRFAEHVGRAGAYDELWRWSVEDVEGFWAAVWSFFRVEGSYRRVLGERAMPGTQWFPGAEVSFSEHLLRGRDPERVAIRHASELRELDGWTWGELHARTAALAQGLRELGVGEGDRVAAYLPNVPETIAAFLATASLGAIWSSAAPEFGAPSVVDRFAQIEPKVLLAVDGYRYGGRDFDRREAVREIAAGIPSLEHVVTFGYLGGEGWPAGFEREGVELSHVRVPFEHPLWVLYSSGTTGLPKAIVHSHGGILLEHLKSAHLHLDLQAGDRVLWFTTTGWMMWNYLVGMLLTPASIVLYDGHPSHPGPEALWDLAARAGATVFGTSAAFIAACMKAGVVPGEGRDLSAIQAVGATGSPLAPEGFRWIYEQLGDDVWLFSTSGGTDVCTAFVGGVPTLPVYEGELQARALGAKVEAWDDDGRPLVDAVGELVVTEPMPSMPVALWGDADGAQLRETYFDTFPGVWRHGDWITVTERGTAVIHGRSDSTINRGGVRMGTSEIYRAVLALPELLDALVVDVPRAGRESWLGLFVVLADGVELDDALTARIAVQVRTHCSPRHVPDEAVALPAVPRTLSGKPLEVPVKRILMGQDPAAFPSRDILANPEALDWLVDFAARWRAR